MDLDVKLRKEQLAEVEQSDIDVAAVYGDEEACKQDEEAEMLPLDDFFDKFRGQGFLRLVMARHLLKDLGLPAPVLEHLRGRFDKVSRDANQTMLSVTSSESPLCSHLVPWKRAYLVLLSKPWNTWPISWKKVTTSSCLIKAGLSGVDLAKLATIAVNG